MSGTRIRSVPAAGIRFPIDPVLPRRNQIASPSQRVENSAWPLRVPSSTCSRKTAAEMRAGGSKPAQDRHIVKAARQRGRILPGDALTHDIRDTQNRPGRRPGFAPASAAGDAGGDPQPENAAAHRMDARDLRDAPGVGLAAPQVGLSVQLAVIEDRPELYASLPPERVAERSGAPCLSRFCSIRASTAPPSGRNSSKAASAWPDSAPWCPARSGSRELSRPSRRAADVPGGGLARQNRPA